MEINKEALLKLLRNSEVTLHLPYSYSGLHSKRKFKLCKVYSIKLFLKIEVVLKPEEIFKSVPNFF